MGKWSGPRPTIQRKKLRELMPEPPIPTLGGLLAQAVSELKQEVQALKERVRALEARLPEDDGK